MGAEFIISFTILAVVTFAAIWMIDPGDGGYS